MDEMSEDSLRLHRVFRDGKQALFRFGKAQGSQKEKNHVAGISPSCKANSTNI
jgi:hypothetical protein